MMKKQSRINWIKVFMVLPLTGMLLALVSMKTVREPYFRSGLSGETHQQEKLEVASLPEWRLGSAQNKAFAYLTTYPWQSTVNHATAQHRHILDLNIKDNNQVLLRGKRVLMENLRFSIAAEAKKLKARNVDLDQVTALIKIQGNTSLEQIEELKDLFIAKDIKNIKVDSLSYTQVSPVLIF